MSKFRNPSIFSLTTLLVILTKVARLLGLAKFLFTRLASRKIGKAKKAIVFRGYSPTKHDVFATIYSKSGTNWALQVIQQTAWLGESQFDHIHSVAAWPEAPLAGIIPIHDLTVRDASPTQMRAIKSGAISSMVPYSKKSKYVCVIRDPKEVFVSSYFFMPNVLGIAGLFSVEEWLEYFISGQFLAGSWPEHTASFWDWRDRPNVLILQFSEIKTDPKGAVQKIIDLMEVKLTDEQFAKVANKASYKYMKSAEEKFAPPLIPLVSKKTAPKMMRKGKSGNSGELLSDAQQQRIDEWAISELKNLGSDFPYGSFFGGGVKFK